MNPLNPLGAVIKAITFPFHALFVVGLCWFINTVTSPQTHWWHWVAFGMTIALIGVWFRALRVLIETIGVVGGAYLVYRWWTNRRGGQALDAQTFRSRFG
jgi:threonine/homoserine/homoserine lactone efflux protein